MRSHPPERLVGPSVELLRHNRADAVELAAAAAASLPELKQFMDWAQSDPTQPEDFLEFLEQSSREWEQGEGYGYHIADRSNAEMIGACGLMRRIGPGGIEIGYWVRSDRAGHGVATECAALLLEAAWPLDNIERIEIHHDVNNPASGRVAEKLGFVEVDRVAVKITSPGEAGINVIWRLTS